jgi:hypothetical protein
MGMNQDHLFRRRAHLPASEVLAAWVDPTMLAQWLWPHLDDAVYRPPFGRGEEFHFSSERLGRTISGRCLDFNRYGFDLTWHIDDSVVSHDGYDILSVRALPADRGSELVVTYGVRSNLATPWVKMWNPALDRLAALRPECSLSVGPARGARRMRAGQLNYA